MFENRPSVHRAVRTSAFVLLLIASSVTALRGGALDARLTPEDTARLGGEVDVHCFSLAVPLPGVVTVDAVVPGDAAAARLVPARGAETAAAPDVIERRADHLTLAFFEPGSRRFCASAQDPRHTLRGLRLRTAFAAFATTKEDEGEIELEPGHLVAPPLPVFDAAELCELGAVDDHGDTLLCATPLGAGLTAQGELANGWGDDRDVFTFAVSEHRTVEITASGTDTYGSLVNELGDRLAADGEGGGFRLVKTLAPGRYFVLVEGAGGAYTLRVAPLDGSSPVELLAEEVRRVGGSGADGGGILLD